MSKYKEVVHMILDQVKASSDDSYLTEDHIIYLIEKFRALILAQTYKDVRKQLPESNYQTICLPLGEYSDFLDIPCIGETYLRSNIKLPVLLPVGNVSVYPMDYFRGEITFITKERMRYVGHNKFLKNIIYCSANPEGYLYFKSSNPQHKQLEMVKMTGIFENCSDAIKLSCVENCNDTDDRACDIMDKEFPLEEALVSMVIQNTVQFISPIQYKPEDTQNNSKDDYGDLANYVRANMKERVSKQME